MSVRISPDEAIEKYGDAQGNILKGHGREHTTLLLVEFTDQGNTREWIRQLLAGLSTGPSVLDTVRITSTAKQLRDRQAFHKSKADAGLFTSLLFTAAGLDYLGAPTPQESQDQTPGHGRASAFATGMRNAATLQLLADPKPTDWDAEWWTNTATGEPSEVHALLLLADDLANRLQPAVAFMTQRSASLGVMVRIAQHGQRLLENGHDIEHFGYADGVSQPLFLNDDNDVEPYPGDVALGAEDLVLVPDTLGSKASSFGSFLVYRKLQQKVRDFKDAEGEEEDAADGTLANVLGLQGSDRARAGAMIVGRFENGTPLTVLGTEEDEAGKPVFTNRFDYHNDQAGLKCPFHAHIRKVNPRGETKDKFGLELRHRITRRGIPYGPKLPDGAPEDGVSRGLLFMCYQRNIGQQFEFMQQAWANTVNFIHGADPAKGISAVDLDPVIGQGMRGALTFPLVYEKAVTRQADFKQFVHLKGGEYFYAPSLSGLQSLVATPVLATAS
jgi:Dyp-type peroxidase family